MNDEDEDAWMFRDDEGDAAVQDMAVELLLKAPMRLVLQSDTVLQVTGLLQLALRHPGVPGSLRATAERFLTGARVYFADCPAVLEVILRGDDPDWRAP